MRLTLPLPTSAILLAMLTGCGGGGGGSTQSEAEPAHISGTITASADSVTDSDTNDPLIDTFRGNDSFATAQTIGTPSTVGGYAAAIGLGPEGQMNRPGTSGDFDDSSDVFKVNLDANQSVVLSIGDISTADLDLFLYDQAGNMVDSSVGVGRQEFVEAPSAASYYVQVYVYSGYSTYVLQSGGVASASAIETLRYRSDFLPGELIVAPKASAPGHFASSVTAKSMGLALLAGDKAPEQLYRIPAEVTLKSQSARRYKDNVPQPAMDERLRTLMAAKELSRSKELRAVAPNYVRHASAVPTDPYAGSQWHYRLINLPLALDRTQGTGALVAVIDTGTILNHPDLVGQLDPNDPDGVDFISDPASAGDGNGADGNSFDTGDRQSPSGSSSFHGTHVAGTILAATNNGVGVAGIAGGARLISLRALGRFGGSSYDIIQAVRYAAGLATDYSSLPRLPRRADVINMSLGGGSPSSVEQDVYNQVAAAGVIVVAAAGNDGTSSLSYPASYQNVISVASVRPDKQRAYYSQFNGMVDVAAPGGEQSYRAEDGVLSTSADDSSTLVSTYRYLQGTSMATPHVAGVVALMKSVYPALTHGQFTALLQSGAITQDLGAAGRDNLYGYGLIDANKAVIKAAELAGAPPVVQPPVASVAPASLEFTASTSQLEFNLANAGGGSLSVTSVTTDQPWLAVSLLSGSSYRVTINRSSLAEGLYTGNVTLNTNGGTVRVAVRADVRVLTGSADVGTLYVLALNKATFEPVVQQVVKVSTSGYAFTLADLPAGTYLIAAGSDLDNDGFICGAGESCGAYNSLDTFTEVVVGAGQSRTGINFPAAFQPVVTASTTALNGSASTSGTGIRRLQ